MLEELIAKLLGLHHNQLRAVIDERFDQLQLRINTMSETADTAFAAISTKLDKLTTDVTAALAALKAGGPLTDEQKAAVASIEAKIDAMDAAVAPPAA